jgi:KaiC/GvpD/RAD55 family RecA-like ATPase
MSVTEEIVDFVDNMKPTEHVLLFYDTPEKKHEILFNFLSTGLAARKGAAYVCSEENPEEVREAMRIHGIDVNKNEEEGNLIVRNYDGWYIQDGQVEFVRILAGWKEIYEKFRTWIASDRRGCLLFQA